MQQRKRSFYEARHEGCPVTPFRDLLYNGRTMQASLICRRASILIFKSCRIPIAALKPLDGAKSIQAWLEKPTRPIASYDDDCDGRTPASSWIGFRPRPWVQDGGTQRLISHTNSRGSSVSSKLARYGIFLGISVIWLTRRRFPIVEGKAKLSHQAISVQIGKPYSGNTYGKSKIDRAGIQITRW